ncbi:PucR family transcriptional regulator [Tindallia magadiensis]|nr:PucR family transcriptional regulator [Tindallia magadiensis]
MTLTHILKLGCFKESQLIAGESAVNSIVVKGITIMEAPDIADWIKGGELILTSLYPVYKDEEKIRLLVQRLAENKAAGLLVKVGRFIEEMPEILIKAGNEYELPIIQIAGEVKYVDIMYPVMNELFNRQLMLLEHYRVCHDRFVQLMLRNGSLQDIAEELKELIQRPVLIFDVDLEVLACTDDEFTPIHKILENRICLKEYGECVLYRQQIWLGEEGKNLVEMILAPAIAFHQERAYVGVVTGGGVTEMEAIAIETAVTNISLELIKKAAVAEVELKYQNELIDEIIHQRYQSIEEVRHRTRDLGWNLDKPHKVMVIQLQDYQTLLTDERGLNMLKDYMDRMLRIIKRLAMHYTSELIISSKSFRIVVLYPVKNKASDVQSFAEELHQCFTRELIGVNICVGIGMESLDIESMFKSYEQAMDSVHFGQIIQQKKKVVTYEELGIYKLLCHMEDADQLRQFIHPGLERLYQYDQSRNNELMETLEVYLNYQGNAKKTAEKMFIHYKTVMYRIKRIKEVMGVDFENRQVKLEIEVGLKILHILWNKKGTTEQGIKRIEEVLTDKKWKRDLSKVDNEIS